MQTPCNSYENNAKHITKRSDPKIKTESFLIEKIYKETKIGLAIATRLLKTANVPEYCVIVSLSNENLSIKNKRCIFFKYRLK